MPNIRAKGESMLQVRIKTELMKRFRIECIKSGTTGPAAIEQIVTAWIEEQERKRGERPEKTTDYRLTASPNGGTWIKDPSRIDENTQN